MRTLNVHTNYTETNDVPIICMHGHQVGELEALLRSKEEAVVKLEANVAKLRKRVSILEEAVREKDEELDRASEEHAADLERAQVRCSVSMHAGSMCINHGQMRTNHHLFVSMCARLRSHTCS